MPISPKNQERIALAVFSQGLRAKGSNISYKLSSEETGGDEDATSMEEERETERNDLDLTIRGIVDEITRRSTPFSLRPEEDYTEDVVLMIRRKDLKNRDGSLLTPTAKADIIINESPWLMKQLDVSTPGLWIMRLSRQGS